jgi:hypothetical protein
VDGTISGDYHADGNKATFTVGKSTGSATLAVGSSKESVSMAKSTTYSLPTAKLDWLAAMTR